LIQLPLVVRSKTTSCGRVELRASPRGSVSITMNARSSKLTADSSSSARSSPSQGGSWPVSSVQAAGLVQFDAF
jgi:hypothetical protein